MAQAYRPRSTVLLLLAPPKRSQPCSSQQKMLPSCQHLPTFTDMPTLLLKNPTIIHPTVITPGPPVLRPYAKRLPFLLATKLCSAEKQKFSRRYRRNNRYNGKGHPKIMPEAPVTLQLLAIPKLGKPPFIFDIISRIHLDGSSAAHFKTIRLWKSRRGQVHIIIRKR